MKKGYYSIVLHAHLPYIRHQEADRLEERWLFEAITETYIPLIWVLEEASQTSIITLSLSPPLLEMLTDPVMKRRYRNYINQTKVLLEKEFNSVTDERTREIVTFYKQRYERIEKTYLEWDGNIVNAFRYFHDHEQLVCVTSSATHTFLPYLQTKEGLRTQIVHGIQCFEKHFGQRPLGFWLPECAFTPGVDRVLFEEGIRYTFVDEHALKAADPTPKNGSEAPVFSPHGVVLFPRNEKLSQMVWSSVSGYPGDYDYREFYRDIAYQRDWEYIKPFVHHEGIRIDTGLKYNRITGDQEDKDLYVREWAEKKVQSHGEHFIASIHDELQNVQTADHPPALLLTPFDAELFGHWWFEGPEWIWHLVTEGASRLPFITPQEYVEKYSHDLETAHVSFSTWGRRGYGEVWLNEKNSWMHRHLHQLEIDLIETTSQFINPSQLEEKAIAQMIREWMLASSSDWAFIIDNESASDYAIERFKTHLGRYQQVKERLFNQTISWQWLTEFESRFPFLSSIDIDMMRSAHDTYIQKKRKSLVEHSVPNSLNILMLSWEFPPMMVGGLARHVFDLSRALCDEGHQVHVITAAVDGYPEYEINQGVHVHRVKSLQPHADQFFHWVGSLNLALADYGSELAKMISFDVIHAHDWLVSVAAKGLKHQLELPLVATIHATEHGRNNGIHDDLQYEINQKEWELTYEADEVIVCSPYMKDEVVHVFSLPKEKVSIFPNGVDPQLIHSEVDEHKKRRHDHDMIVFSVGRIVKEKGFQTIIDAAPIVREKHPHVKFLIAGKGPMLDEYRALVEERGLEELVQFLGFISDEERNQLLTTCDIALFPSLYEPFGIVALEGMVAGKPTIVSDTGGLAGIIRHKENGLKMLPGDPSSLALQVDHMITDQEGAMNLAKQGKIDAETVFSWRSIAEDTSRLFEKLSLK
ncbi:DUF1957 domain-containing protein [Desertibacillus haloalkaliphilus]|nr:DUF1957 domain-containing protein [Desertibacillus haloalkaliphilus]